jgi:hypothetical protein
MKNPKYQANNDKSSKGTSDKTAPKEIQTGYLP